MKKFKTFVAEFKVYEPKSVDTLGFTRDNLDKPIVFIALATEPMLPGCIVSTKTMFIKLLFKDIQLLC